jgi:hypothetical protein
MSCFLCKKSRPAKVKNTTWFELGNFAGMIEESDNIVCDSVQKLFSRLLRPIGVRSSRRCNNCKEEYLLKMRLTPPDVLVLLRGLAKGGNSFHANNELSLDITPISSPEENAVPEQTVEYELVGAAFYDAQHYVSAWRDDMSGEARWFFHDGWHR